MKQCISFDQYNVKILRKDVIGNRTAEIKDFHTLNLLKRGSKALDDNNFLLVQIYFDMKLDFSINTQLVSGLNMTRDGYEKMHCSIFNIDTVSKSFYFE